MLTCFFSPPWLPGGGKGEGTGGDDDDGGKCFPSLKHQHSYLNGHLRWGPKFFIQNDNKKTP